MFLSVWIRIESVAGGGIDGRRVVEVVVYGLWVLVVHVMVGFGVWCGGLW